MMFTLLHGDALAMLMTLESESVQCVCTSPPYFGLRDYGVDGQIGLEPHPAEFVRALVTIFDEVRRVMRQDGTLWVNLGDSYAGSGRGPQGQNGIGNHTVRQGFSKAPDQMGAFRGKKLRNNQGATSNLSFDGLKPKDLMLIPERFAIAMQERDWWVRSEIVWAKTSAMPESVKDRPSSAWEPIWMFSKSRRYFYDADAVKMPLKEPSLMAPSGFGGHKRNGGSTYSGNAYDARSLSGANLRNVWILGPEPSKEEHYASFPTEIPRRCILAATSEKGQCPACGSPWLREVKRATTYESNASKAGNFSLNGKGHPTDQIRADHDIRHGPVGHSKTLGWSPSCRCDAGDPVPQIVLDPFAGSGTTLLVAERLGRDSIGIDLNPEYIALARRRIEHEVPITVDGQTTYRGAALDRQVSLFEEVAG